MSPAERVAARIAQAVADAPPLPARLASRVRALVLASKPCPAQPSSSESGRAAA